jgi:hypothetical protein
MSVWENFFLGQLGASATLAGLVFVAISINLKKIMESSYLPNFALEALIAFVTTLFVALLMLIPTHAFVVWGIGALVLGLLNWMAMIWLYIDTLRKIEVSHRLPVATRLLLYQLAAIAILAAGLTFLVWGAAGFYWIVAATVLSFLAAFSDTWLLVVEINR